MARSWLTKNREWERVQRDLRILELDLIRYDTRIHFQGSPECLAARQLIQEASATLAGSHANVESAWSKLHAARRHSLFALTPEERALKSAVLWIEAKEKVSSWRRDAISRLLCMESGPGSPAETKSVAFANVTAAQLSEAMCILDEYNSNQYHKLWLAADQLGMLLWASALATVLLLPPLLIAAHKNWAQAVHESWTVAGWCWTMVSAVLLFGLLGGAFSVAQSLFPNATAQKIPDRVANHWTILIRVLFGSIGGLAGYTFYEANLLNARTLLSDSVAARLTIAFLFGYTGEKLISSVASTFSLASSKHP